MIIDSVMLNCFLRSLDILIPKSTRDLIRSVVQREGILIHDFKFRNMRESVPCDELVLDALSHLSQSLLQVDDRGTIQKYLIGAMESRISRAVEIQIDQISVRSELHRNIAFGLSSHTFLS